ncbi:hypothetical protein QBC39DRAFT_240565, partial [Podospora conica]
MAVGWLTNLFVPNSSSHLLHDQTGFAVNTEKASCFQVSSVNPDLSSRPLFETIRKFGDLLPTRRLHGSGNDSDEPPQAWTTDHRCGALHVATLNVGTLQRIGKIKIEWTSILTNHL